MLIIPGQSVKQREFCDILTEHCKIERHAGREVYPPAPKQEMSGAGKEMMTVSRNHLLYLAALLTT
jgi:hypothetical protein